MLTKLHFQKAVDLIVEEKSGHHNLTETWCRFFRSFPSGFNEHKFRRAVASGLREKGMCFSSYAVMPEPTDDTQPEQWDKKEQLWLTEDITMSVTCEECGLPTGEGEMRWDEQTHKAVCKQCLHETGDTGDGQDTA